jgi:Fur family zinc uptake transcriptional regulator
MSLALADHDAFACTGASHRRCRDQALAAAEAHCAARGEKLTPTRRQVLALIWASHRPLGAYAILEKLAEGGKRPAPPTVYRALDFLLEQRLIHRLDSLNAFTGCTHPGEAHRGQFLICQACGNAQEIADAAVTQAIAAAAAAQGFQVRHEAVEVTGLCHACRDAGT